jgi:predicted  nucleic acid-binding Zn-ribbon protein
MSSITLSSPWVEGSTMRVFNVKNKQFIPFSDFCDAIGSDQYRVNKAYTKDIFVNPKDVDPEFDWNSRNLKKIFSTEYLPDILKKATDWDESKISNAIEQLSAGHPKLRLKKKSPPSDPRPQLNVASELKKMRESIDRAVLNIGPASMMIYMETDDFKQAVKEEVKNKVGEWRKKVEEKLENEMREQVEQKIIATYKRERQEELKEVDHQEKIKALKTVMTSKKNYEIDLNEISF